MTNGASFTWRKIIEEAWLGLANERLGAKKVDAAATVFLAALMAKIFSFRGRGGVVVVEGENVPPTKKHH